MNLRKDHYRAIDRCGPAPSDPLFRTRVRETVVDRARPAPRLRSRPSGGPAGVPAHARPSTASFGPSTGVREAGRQAGVRRPSRSVMTATRSLWRVAGAWGRASRLVGGGGARPGAARLRSRGSKNGRPPARAVAAAVARLARCLFLFACVCSSCSKPARGGGGVERPSPLAARPSATAEVARRRPTFAQL